MSEDGDSPIRNQENNQAHVDVDEGHNLVEITDLEEAGDILNIQSVSTVTVQTTMNVIAQRTSSVIDRNVVLTNAVERKSTRKDRRLGLRRRVKLKVKLTRPKENFHRQPGMK